MSYLASHLSPEWFGALGCGLFTLAIWGILYILLSAILRGLKRSKR